MKVTIDQETFDRVSSALSVLVGMSAIYHKGAFEKYADLAAELDDLWNETAFEDED